VTAIIFDFGNVLGFFDHRLATARLAKHSDLTPEAIYGLLHGGELEDDYESGRLSTADYLCRVRQRCRLRCSDDELTEAYSDIFWPNEELYPLLPRLKERHRLLVGSNTTELHTRQFRRQFADVLQHFDHLVLSHEIGARKPQPAFFKHCERFAECQAEECLLIDDIPANVAGAMACGWQGLVYTGFRSLCDRLQELRLM
jgi:putative hydrolase of the HAD superfamily